jgi:uncharacterized protein (TIGR02145 family)
MKKSTSLLLLLCFTLTVWSQSPEKMSYQAVVKDMNNNLLANQQVGMQISILQGSESGNLIYQETHLPTTNGNGLVSIEIGMGTVVSGDFSTIDWTLGSYLIQSEIDPTGGSNYSISGFSPVLSVPYALHANTFSGDMKNKSISNLADPIDDQDATSKIYVDKLKADIEILKERIYELELRSGLIVLEDIEGNKYETVKIGEQVWMAENLRTTTLNDGTPIPHVTDNTEWALSKSAAYCWYNNDENQYRDIYGALYNWYTVETEKLCPSGWHVPSEEEWSILVDFLGGNAAGGGKLKQTGLDYWQSPNYGASNSTGFTALPAGNRRSHGVFMDIGYRTSWYSTILITEEYARQYEVFWNGEHINKASSSLAIGLSIRCIMDQ